MKFLTLIFGIILLLVLNLSAQNEVINVYDYVNVNDPDFLKSCDFNRQSLNLMLVKTKMRDKGISLEERKKFERGNELNRKRAKCDQIVWNKIVYVSDSKQLKLLKDALLIEITRLNGLIKKVDFKYRQKKTIEQFKNMGGNPTNIASLTGAIENSTNNQKVAWLNKLYRNGKIRIGSSKPIEVSKDSNLEAEFLAEIAKINSDIAVINRLAREKQIVESFGSAQILCDKLRRYQGQQYFSTSLKKIRKENPGFSFSITPLAEQVTREYWIRMRNRANHAYRNAMEAYRGCVWNEGIQQAAIVEIPFAYIKLTNDMFNTVKDMFSKQLAGTFQKIYKGYQNPSESLRPVMLISEDILAGGNDAYDWKTYIGIVGGVISGYDSFVKAQNMVTQYGVQGELIQANRETADQLITSGRNLLQQFDKYRAFIDSHSSSIDCLNDRIMRIDLDNKSIKGVKITIWGTGLYDWDGEEFIDQIKEGGEDLKNEYIYCEDFIKILQIAFNQGNTDYQTIDEKVRSSGADQTQIAAQISYNEENSDWFEQEISRLTEYYIQFCENEGNTFPDDVVIVSTNVIPGVEDQNVEPYEEPEPEYPYEEYNEPVHHEPIYDEPDHNPYSGGGSSTGVTIQGDGWSAQKIKNNPTAIQNDINNAINSGKTPAGIYVSDGHEVVVYYIEGNPLGMTSWNLEWYDNPETLQTGISNNLEHGYFPMGISFTDNGQLYVLYIMSELSATAWQLVESELELNYVANDLQSHIHEKYIPVGITVYGGMYYTLMVQLPDAEMTNWTIEGYEDNNYTIKQNVNNKANLGLIPFGYLKEGEIVNILFVGF